MLNDERIQGETERQDSSSQGPPDFWERQLKAGEPTPYTEIVISSTEGSPSAESGSSWRRPAGGSLEVPPSGRTAGREPWAGAGARALGWREPGGPTDRGAGGFYTKNTSN